MRDTAIPLNVSRMSADEVAAAEDFLNARRPEGRSLRSIELSVHRGRFRMDDEGVEPADEEFRRLRPEILAEQKHTCRFCAHKQVGAMQIHHMNCVHADNGRENLAVTCFMCHACHHLWLAGKSRTNQDAPGAYIIYAPGIEQELLNRYLMATFAVKAMGGEPAERATRDLAELLKLREPVVEMWGTDSAQMFGLMLAEMPATMYEQRFLLLSGLKMVMTEDSFMYQPDAILGLAQNWQKTFPAKSWGALREQVFG